MPQAITPWSQRATLVPLTRVHALNALSDAFVVVALANTLFFGVPVGEARGRVALYLLITMLPFAVVAPVIGPLLDRFRSGRRTAIAVTLAGRAALAWAMASAGGGLELYPAAFGLLVLSKAYGVTRAAAVPRMLPEGVTLVRANARLSATSLAASTVGGLASAGVVALADYGWSLRIGALLFLVATGFALALPARVNGTDEPGIGREHLRPPSFPPPARAALLATVALRALAGFLTTFLAFLLREQGSGTGGIALLAGAAAAGGLVGTLLGSALGRHAPRLLLRISLGACTVACVVGAIRFGLGTAVLAAAVCALGGALGKLAFDSVLQVELPERVRGQAFARAETTLQLAWVAGGAVGIALPLRGALGLGLAAAGLVAGAVVALRAEKAVPVA